MRPGRNPCLCDPSPDCLHMLIQRGEEERSGLQENARRGLHALRLSGILQARLAFIHRSGQRVAHREVVEGVTDIRVAHEDDPAVTAVTRAWTGQAPAWHHDGAQNDLDPDHSQRGCIMAVAGREEEHWPDVDCDCAVSFYFPRLAR
jgi:hypothetical protein